MSQSRLLVDVVHHGDTYTAIEYVAMSSSVDVNFIGTVLLKSKTIEITLHDESSHRVNSVYQEFKIEVTAIFLAAHFENLTLLRNLMFNSNVEVDDVNVI
ncbi:hypothetical protein RYX36_014895 [Vicia faba]